MTSRYNIKTVKIARELNLPFYATRNEILIGSLPGIAAALTLGCMSEGDGGIHFRTSQEYDDLFQENKNPHTLKVNSFEDSLPAIVKIKEYESR